MSAKAETGCYAAAAGSRSAQLDLIVVGPSGMWIVDSKHWNDFSIGGGSMFRGQADVADEVLRLANVAHEAEAAFADVGLAAGEAQSVLAMHGRSKCIGEVGPVEVVSADDIHRHFAKRGTRLSISEVETGIPRSSTTSQRRPSMTGP